MEDQNLTWGQKMVGLSFNPSANKSVDRIKIRTADLLDEIKELQQQSTGEEFFFYQEAITSVLTGQMFAVKGATWKR